MVTNYIRNKIAGAPADTLFFNRDFINFGSRGAVDMCLIRMENQGYIRRLCYGVYVRYDCNREFTATELGAAKAKRFNRTVAIHPSKTAQVLKFADTDDCAIKFHTQGRTTSFRTTKGRVHFYATSPRRVALTEIKTGSSINALWWLTKSVATKGHIYDVLSKLKRSEKEEFLWSHDLMPGWLSDLVHEACDGKIHFPLGKKKAC